MLLNNFAAILIFMVSGHLCDLQHDDLKADLHDLRALVADLKINQETLRQSTNDHTVVHWLQTTVAELRAEMAELASQIDLNRGQSSQAMVRLDNSVEHFNHEIQQTRKDIQEMTIHISKMDASQDESHATAEEKGHIRHHVRILSEELKHLWLEVKHITARQKTLETTCQMVHHHIQRHHHGQKKPTNSAQVNP